MDVWGPIIGVFLTGLLVGWFLIYFCKKLEKYKIHGFVTAISAVFGGVILQWISKGEAFWWIYPIG